VQLPIESTRAGPSAATALELTRGPREAAIVRPTKVVAIGVNYRQHAEEMGKPLPAEPLMFLKATSALIGPGQAIELPPGFQRIDYEAELGVVIGERVRHVTAARALEAVAGYTCLNDVTVRDLQTRDGQWSRAKGFDTFCPIGPRVVGGLDPRDLRIVCRVNGLTRQDARTSDLIFSVPDIIAFISKVMTLEPGDIIATGTPSGVGPLAPGDRVEVEIEGVGVLANPVVEAASPG
jgi:2-keto-4-pentenoate hydratase/2-oxohepta-3-ene-1,7-dioic acid hydratase in catechol pathway